MNKLSVSMKRYPNHDFDGLRVGGKTGVPIDHDKYQTIGLVILLLCAYAGYRVYLTSEKIRLIDNDPVLSRPLRTIVRVNSAKPAELSLLPGIGPKLAKAIIEFRNSQGPIRSWEHFEEIRGIGPKMVEKIRPYASLK
jgi:competence protein ComEA